MMAQSTLHPAGPVAEAVLALFWPMVALLGGIWLAVMLVLALGLRRRGAPGTARGVVLGAVAGTALVVTGLTVASAFASRALNASDEAPLVVRVRGLQWWWQVNYPGFVTANEIRIPVGRAVRLELSSDDVIHSFWLPNLAGKQDMIPGRDNALVIRADGPGTWRAQCAEFCGLQHAHMALWVVAEPAEDFARWQAAQAAPAVDAPHPGRRVFEQRQCGACHTVRGSAAKGEAGPDLTHIASRLTLGAGLLPVNRGTLAAWIADPQTLKPGNNMPLVPLAPDELQALADWLAGLR